MTTAWQGIAALSGALFTVSPLENGFCVVHHKLFRGSKHALDVESRVCDTIDHTPRIAAGPTKVAFFDLGM